MHKAPEVAEAIMKIHKRIKAVYRKNPVEGEYRVRKLELIGGEPIEETEVKEHGIRMRLNVHKVFYSPRMATDRWEVAKKVKPYERVLVPFAGIGPYALLIAKQEPTAQVVGIELNPDAVKYFEENIKLNKLTNVKVIQGDAAQEILNWRRWADRIVMPIPMYAEHFLKPISEAVSKRTYIYVYLFVDAKNPLEEGKKKIEEALGMPFVVVSYRKLRSYSKEVDEYVFEIMTSEDFHPKAKLREQFVQYLRGKGEKPSLEYKIVDLEKTPLEKLPDIKRTTDFLIGVWKRKWNPGVDYVLEAISKEELP